MWPLPISARQSEPACASLDGPTEIFRLLQSRPDRGHNFGSLNTFTSRGFASIHDSYLSHDGGQSSALPLTKIDKRRCIRQEPFMFASALAVPFGLVFRLT